MSDAHDNHGHSADDGHGHDAAPALDSLLYGVLAEYDSPRTSCAIEAAKKVARRRLHLQF